MELNEDFCNDYVNIYFKNIYDNLANGLKEVFDNSELCDTLLVSNDGKQIKCHKIILSIFSSHFRSIFNFETFKFNPSYYPVIIFNDLNYEELSAITQLIYKREINIPREKFDIIMKAAQVLKINNLLGWSKITSRSASNDSNQEQKLLLTSPTLVTSENGQSKMVTLVQPIKRTAKDVTIISNQSDQKRVKSISNSSAKISIKEDVSSTLDTSLLINTLSSPTFVNETINNESERTKPCLALTRGNQEVLEKFQKKTGNGNKFRLKHNDKQTTSNFAPNTDLQIISLRDELRSANQLLNNSNDGPNEFSFSHFDDSYLNGSVEDGDEDDFDEAEEDGVQCIQSLTEYSNSYPCDNKQQILTYYVLQSNANNHITESQNHQYPQTTSFIIETKEDGNSKEKMYRCAKCDKVFSRQDHCKNHYLSVHLNKRYPCNLCPSIYRYAKGLLRHRKNKHSKQGETSTNSLPLTITDH